MTSLPIFLGLLILAAYMCLFRLWRGPTAPDRTVAIDTLGTLVVGFCALFALSEGEAFYLHVAMAWTLLSFIGTIALAKYLEGKPFDE